MSRQSLEDLLQTVRSPVELLRNSQIGPYVYPVVPREFTSWIDEQQAWQKTCVLFNQSFHMTDMYVDGPDALKLLSDLGVNSFNNFTTDKAKQFVACNYDGHVIGDVVLFHLSKNRFNLVGRPSVHNWVQYHCETGGYNAETQRDERSAAREGPPSRKVYRYQVQGPYAGKVIEKVTGKAAPDIKFFNMGEFKIARRKVHALRHGMVGQPGWELFGPWAEGEEVKAAIVEAGREFGLRQVGSRAYSSNTLESGWIPSPLPAVYTGDQMKPYRQWLPAASYEGTASLGGSFQSDDIRDYYLTPHDLGYGSIVKFDHDFIGKDALQKMKPRRKKVTLAWNADDVEQVFRSLLTPGGLPAKYMDMPSAVYSTLPYDKVLVNGKIAGISTWTGCSSNERSILSLAILDEEHAAIGTDVTVVWGEEGGGTTKPTVERHVQKEIRAKVGPVPYAEVARTAYRST
jgi:glycine cleavage system aminomethyltransferase T